MIILGIIVTTTDYYTSSLKIKILGSYTTCFTVVFDTFWLFANYLENHKEFYNFNLNPKSQLD